MQLVSAMPAGRTVRHDRSAALGASIGQRTSASTRDRWRKFPFEECTKVVPPSAAPSRPVNCGSVALAATGVCLYTALLRRGSVALYQLVLFARHEAWPERHRPCHW